MLEDLFITEPQNSSPSAEQQLPEDVQAWPMAIQSYVMSASPMLASMPGDLIMDAIDEQKLFGKGSYVIDVGPKKLIVPIVIKAGMLQPIDVFIFNDKWYPLDDDYLRTAMTDAGLGVDTFDIKDLPPTATSSLIGNTRAPTRPYSGMMTDKVIQASVKPSSLTAELLDMVKNSAAVMKNLKRNKTAAARFVALLDNDRPLFKVASAENPLKGDAVIISTGNGKFSVKTAEASVSVDGDQLADLVKEAGVDAKRVFEDLIAYKVATSWDDRAKQSTEKLGSADKMGVYTCYKVASGKAEAGTFAVLASVKDIGGKDTEDLIAVAENGDYAKQSDIAGKLDDSKKPFADAVSSDDLKGGMRIMIPIPGDDEDEDEEGCGCSPISALEPIMLNSTVEGPESVVHEGSNDSGAPVSIIIVKGASLTHPILAKNVPSKYMAKKASTCWYVPSGYPVYKLAGKKVDLVRNAADMNFYNLLEKNASAEVPVRIWKTGRNSNAVKIASENPVILGDSEAMLFMRKVAGSGVVEFLAKLSAGKTVSFKGAFPDDLRASLGSLDEQRKHEALKKQVEDAAKTRDEEKPKEKKASDRLSILKVASALDGAEDIDTVLALNYVTPENILEFVRLLPDFRKTENDLSKLLISTRLGNPTVDEKDVKSALTQLHEVVKSLQNYM